MTEFTRIQICDCFKFNDIEELAFIDALVDDQLISEGFDPFYTITKSAFCKPLANALVDFANAPTEKFWIGKSDTAPSIIAFIVQDTESASSDAYHFSAFIKLLV